MRKNVSEYMHDQLIHSIRSTIELSDAQMDAVLGKFLPVTYDKNSTVNTYHANNRYAYYVHRGALRTFVVDEEGVDKTMELSFEGSWTGDIHSFLYGEPSKVTVDCIEDVELLRISFNDLNDLFREVPAMEKYFRTLYSYAYSAYFKRFSEFMRWSARQRYTSIMENQPEILARIPLKFLASYIGITPESLSRIRKSIV